MAILPRANRIDVNDGGSIRVREEETAPVQGPDPDVHPAKTTEPEKSSGGGGVNVTLNPSGYQASGYTAPSYSVAPYDPTTNKAYMEAMAQLDKAYANNPTYTPTYDAEIQRLYNEIVNRGKFNYDLLSDPLYQQYREQYVNQGNMAMMDAMGQAAALTGGYGSSYSQAVGQQQYNNYLNALNQMVPEFYDRAFNYWQAQGQDLYNQYGLVADMRDTEYGRYRDEVSDYWNNVGYLAGRADTYYNQGADNYWNTESMNQQNYWNEQNMNFENHWNEQNMNFDNYWNTVNYELDAYNATKPSGSDSDNKPYEGNVNINDDIQDYDALYKDYLEAKKNGSSDDEIRNDIETQYENGNISYNTYINLLNNLKLRQDDGIKTSR